MFLFGSSHLHYVITTQFFRLSCSQIKNPARLHLDFFISPLQAKMAPDNQFSSTPQSVPAAQLALRPHSKAGMAPYDQSTSTPQSAPAIRMTLISAPGDPPRYSLFGPPSYKEGCLTRYTNSRLLRLPLSSARPYSNTLCLIQEAFAAQ
jgi:hypothetical protein